MKKISLLIITLLISSLTAFTFAQVDVTFQVDMANEGSISMWGVHIAGSFQDEAGYPGDWDPSTTELTQVGTSTVYAVTVTLPEGYYEFKYLNGDAWGDDESVPGECAANNNRYVNVGTEPMVLDVVCFGSCTECMTQVDVTFQVNMANETVAGPVYLAGDFNGWSNNSTEMTLDHDAVYTYTMALPIGSYYEYKFLNGSDGWENVPGCCNQNGNRYLTVPEEDLVLDVVCFAHCIDCTISQPVDLTFQVDMNNQTVSPDGVHLVGSFQGFDLNSAIPMTNAGNGVYTATATVNSNQCIEYKFLNGVTWDDAEVVPAECVTGYNRYMVVPDGNTMLDPVCFGECGPCGGGVSDLFFSEYAEGSSNNKYIEIYNGTGGTVDLSQYTVKLGSNGNDWGNTLTPDATLEDGDVFVIANSGADPYILDRADVTSSVTYFNGNDALGLFHNDVLIDVIGVQGESVYWPVAGTSEGLKDHTIIRKQNVCSPTTDWALSAGTDETNSQWIVEPQNYWDNLGFHNAVCGGTAIAEAPAFSQGSGTYFSAFDLELTSGTPGAEIHYTTDGTDPDYSSPEYTGPINLSTNTTVKAITFAPGYVKSFITQATYAFEEVVQVNDLAELRSMYAADPAVYYEVTGEVVLTFQQNYRHQKYVQDASAAILIDDNPGVINTTYQIGDGITGLIGSLTEYGNMLEFIPATDPGAPTSTGNVITPQVITISEMMTNFEEYEAELVQLMDVTFANGGELFATGTTYPISDDSKAEGNFYTNFYDADYIGTPVPPVPCDVTGLCNARYNGNFITSRSLDDLNVPPTLIVISPNGGEQIEQGTEYEITWDSFLYDGNIDVELVSELTKDVVTLASNVPVDNGSYAWNVVQDYGDNYKIHITATDGELEDYSDNFFSIVPPFDIRITEIMYNPPVYDEYYEFVEFYNNGEGTVNLQDWEITQGVSFTFPEHYIAPGEYVVVCADSEEFMALFGVEAYQFSGGLSNGGEDIELRDNHGQVRAYVNYDDGGDWYPVTDGDGPSLTFCDPSLDNNDPVNWSVSTNLAAVYEGTGLYCTPGAGCNTNPALPVWYDGGWNGISSNLMPEGKMMMEDLFAPALDNTVILMGEDGIFWPGQNINTLGNWDTYQGYKIKFTGDTYFVFPGMELTDRSVTLEPGIHYIPVLSQEPVDVANVIAPLGNAIEFVFDIHYGGVYWPTGGIVPGITGALETLYPGYAYLARINEPVTINFEMAPGKSANRPMTAENTTPWNDVLASGQQHIISVTANAIAQLEDGDVIGAFNAQGTCTGMAAYNSGDKALSLVVYGDDETTEAIDGMTAGEAISLKLYRNGQNMDVAAVYNTSMKDHSGLYVQNGLSMISDLKLGATGINDPEAAYSIYPNPGNGLFNIDINGTWNVEVTNAQGQLIRTERISGSSTLDLSSQPEGIYFVKLTNQTSTLTQKVIIR